MHHKDAILDSLAMRGNVAQFVAFRPDSGKARQSHSRIAIRSTCAAISPAILAAGSSCMD